MTCSFPYATMGDAAVHTLSDDSSTLEDSIDVRRYVLAASHWWWAILLGALAGAIAAYAVAANQQPTYRTSTLLMVGGSLEAMNPTTGEMQTSEKLAYTYAEIAKTRPVLDATIASLGLLDDAFDESFPKMAVSVLSSTQLMRITATDTSPARAAAVADELARQLIARGPGSDHSLQPYQTFVEAQLASLEAQMQGVSDAIGVADRTGNAQETTRLQNSMRDLRTQYSETLALLPSADANILQVIEPARVPTRPESPNVARGTVLGGLAGMIVVTLVVCVAAYVDDTIRSADDIERQFALPVLGEIVEFPAAREGTAQHALVSEDLLSPHAEGLRLLYTNLRYSLPSAPGARAFLLTSASPQEGKSTIAANLGVVSALAGRPTIVVDADMRRPRQQEILGHHTSRGLSSLLIGEAEIDDVLQATETEGLSVIPCGTVPPNPAELLGSARMTEILEMLAQRAEVIVVDSPPVLAAADASILASQVSGVILVAAYGRTKRRDALHATEAIARVQGKMLGVVLNRMPVHAGLGYGYRYAYTYGADHNKGKTRGGRVWPFASRTHGVRDAKSRLRMLNGHPEQPVADHDHSQSV